MNVLPARYLSLVCTFFLVGGYFSPQPAEADAPSPTLSSVSKTASKVPTRFLRVSGKNILGDNGKPVLLRGFNMDTNNYQFQWDESSPWTNAYQKDIQYLKTLGVNSIRLALHWRYFDSPMGYKLIDSYLRWCEQAGIYVILDMHVAPPEETNDNGKFWTDPVSRQKLLDLWSAIAARYANRTIVAGYDLFNEPAPPQEDQWWTLVSDISSVIRAVDNQHILFIEPAMTGQGEGDFRLQNDPNVVYSYHDYYPFIMTHAGYGWAGDSPVPVDYPYPGRALTGLEWANWAPDAATFKGKATSWKQQVSGSLTVPTGAEFATIKLSVAGNVGSVWFDDVSLKQNGRVFPVFNPAMEDPSILDAKNPANWTFWSSGNFTGQWDSKNRQSSRGHSLKLSGNDVSGFAVWTQQAGTFTDPLLKVKAGDKLEVRGWVYAPQNRGGEISISVDYLKGNYQQYNKSQLLADVNRYLQWAKTSNVPLYVGEFGALSASPQDTRYNIIRDKISVMNTAGVGWGLWSYRNFSSPYFGLYLNEKLDTRLADIVKAGLK